MLPRRVLSCGCAVLVGGLLLSGFAWGEDLAIDLAAPESGSAWIFTDSNGRIENGELILNARQHVTRAFYTPKTWGDVTLSAKFFVEPADKGVLCCGFVFRAKNGGEFYYVHYDQGQAILCRSDAANGWNEIKRLGKLDKPAGQWHEGKVQCVGDTIRVSLNGQLLYEAKDATLKDGCIGFYGSQGLVHVKDIVVSGEPKDREGEFVLPPQNWVHVCTDAGAGAYEAFPDVCRLQDGRLMCVFYAGYGHVALPNEALPKGGRVSYCLSSDEGRTWTDAQVLYDGPDDDRDPSIVQLSTGRLLCNFFSLRKTEGQRPGWRGLGSWVVKSDDVGKTWSEPIRVSETYYCSSPVRALSDGRLILGLYAEESGEGWGAVSISEDQGDTWCPVIDIDNNGMPLDAETDIITLKDGTLFAAERGRAETMAWSVSKDGGRSWSVSEPFGFPGHCPYLHRTLDGIILMAHRLPKTSLHYSLDEGKTWSENVPVDDVIGAYPSMVNLKDGTVLIVYYEEGEMSSIRAKRFLATKKGIKWIPVDQGPVPSATLVDYRCIWDAAPHNAFTNLRYHDGQWYCVFREGQGHVSPDGALRVLGSKDGDEWESLAKVTSDTADLRDAQITVMPDGRLMLSGAGALHNPVPVKHQSVAFFSEDGRTWSPPAEIGDPNVWLWRITWHKGTAYGIGYSTSSDDRFIRLYKSTDGKNFETLIERLRDTEYSNESALVFLEDDSCYCLLRRDQNGVSGLLGRSEPPYTEWTWKDLGVRIGGPNMIRMPDGRFVAAVRLYDGGARTGLCWVDTEAGTLTEFLSLPSGGDTSYPGLVWHEGLLWVSYYSSHEGKTSIYLAKVKFD